MIERILLKIIQWLIDMLISYAKQEMGRIKREREIEETNERNEQAYREAETRAERIARAKDLLSGVDAPRT